MNEKYTPEIIVNNPEQHKEDLERQLVHLQVMFCDRLYQKYKDKCKEENKPVDKTFTDILEEQESYYVGDLRMLEMIYSEKNLSEEELYDLIVEKHYKSLDKLYSQLPEGDADDNSSEYITSRAKELNILIDYLKDKQRKAKEEFPDKWLDMTEKSEDENGKVENMAGVIAYNSLKKKYNYDRSQIKTALKEEGFLESDDFLEIHLPTRVGEKGGINRKEIKESLACLAEKIVDKHPEIRAIVAESWFLSHPVFRRFIEMKVIGETGNNWRQLIGDNGQIKQERVKELFSTGKMPYKNLIGYISVEDFLQKYLPEERRGEIELKNNE